MKVCSSTLANGMRVVCHHNPMTAMAAVNILYDVGARDENPELTGIAHLFEHLMFAGSENIRDFDAAMERAGATTNAWTSNDFTDFYCSIPAGNIETALWAESDRMLSLSLNGESLKAQKDVVTEEFYQTTLTPPYGDIMDEFRKLAYKVHPYRWNVIGMTPDHIAKATLADIRDFFGTHYGPDNAILSIAGPTPPETVFGLARKWFGDIPPRNRKPRCLPQEPVQTAPREAAVYRDIPAPHITIGFHTGGYKSQQSQAADLLTDILAYGHSSRAYRNMMLGTDLFADFDITILGSEDPGLLMFNARLRDNAPGNVDRALRKIDTFIDELLDGGVTEYELRRAQNQFESNLIFSNVSNPAKARNMAMDTFHGESTESKLQTVLGFTPEMINSAAAEIMKESNKSTLLYLPK